MSEEAEHELREAVQASEALQGQLSGIEEQLSYLQALSGEFARARDALEALKEATPGEEVLMSIGGGNFIHAKVPNPNAVISGIGAGYSVEGSVADALRRAEAQLDAAREASQRLQEEGQRIMTQMQQLEQRVNQLAG